MQDPNAAARAYLHEYCDPEHKRDFAVLLDGPWGAGKTYFIKDFLSQIPKHLYVSLYGLSNTQQIDDELFRQLHPVLSAPTMKVMGRVAKGLLKGTLKIDLDGDGKDDGSASINIPELGLQKELSSPDGHLLVFDDLERCSLPVGEVLGYINAFVEHAGVKAIIIANQDEILARGKDDNNADRRYSEIKEKLIGQTLRITSTAEQAYHHFMEGISSAEVRKFLSDHAGDVIAMHHMSETHNLRLLKQALWDYERLAQHFQKHHWQNKEGMKALLQVILTVSIEHRRGFLVQHEQVRRLLDNSVLRAMKRQESGELSPEDAVEQRYRTVSFNQTGLTADVISGAIIEGKVEKAEMLAVLAKSPMFAAPSEVPLWLRAWDYFELTDDQAVAIANEFMQAFDQRAFVERGIVFHAFGILREYAELGVIPLKVPEVVPACKKYVDDLAAEDKLEKDFKNVPSWERHESFAQHGYLSARTDEFKQAVRYYLDKSDEIIRRKYPEYLDGLLKDLEAGRDGFLLDLTANNVRPPRFADKPILTAISPADFLSRVLKMGPKQQREAFITLKLRHQGFPNEALKSEKPWLSELHTALSDRIREFGPVTAQRLGAYLNESLAAFEPMATAASEANSGG